MLRVVFFGNSDGVFANRHFQALLDAPCDLVGVVDVPPEKRTSTNTRTLAESTSFVEIARRRGVPTFEPTNPNTPEFVAAIKDLAPDLFIAVGYMNLLRSRILEVPRIVAANFHASLLPAYRGKHPVFWALRNGERWAGLTVHVMDPHLDAGDILFQVRVRTRRRDSVGALYDRIMDKSVGLVGRLIEAAEKGRLPRRPQTAEGSSYYSSVRPEDLQIDWSRDAEQLRRWIVASPGQCSFEVAGQRVFVFDAEVAASSDRAGPGALTRIGRSSCTVAAGKDALRIRRARLDGASEQPVPELCRRLGLELGRPVT